MRPTLSLREVQQSATALVRSLLSEHSRLSTQELFRLGVGDARPVLPADHAIQADGRLRMKKVSNMREGSRLWVPPPTAPYPGHPFRSVQYFKKNILHQLEASGLIRLVEFREPMTDEADREVARRKAHVYTLRRERAAVKAAKGGGIRQDVVPVEPDYTIKRFAWVLGDSPVPDVRQSTSVPTPPDVNLAWNASHELEKRRLQAEAEEAAAIAERRERRRLHWQAEAQAYKAARQRLMDAGQWEAFLTRKAEQERRQQAINSIRQYAQATGEDVSEWFSELGVRDRRSMFGRGRWQTDEERDDLAAEHYRQEQAAQVELERERERRAIHTGDRGDTTPFGLKRDDRASSVQTDGAGQAEAEDDKALSTTFPADMAWREQLAANLPPGSDSPFILRSQSPSTNRALWRDRDMGRNHGEAAREGVMTEADRARGRERLEWSRSVQSSERSRGESRTFGQR